MSKYFTTNSSQTCLPGLGAEELDVREIDKILSVLREAITTSQGPLSKPDTAEQLSKQVECLTGHDGTITLEGLGVDLALDVFASLLVKEGIPTNHTGYLAYVGASPTPASVLMDSLLSASGKIGSAWLGGAGLIWAENQVLQWLSSLAGLPEKAGGCFVSGGTAGNLSALVAARSNFRTKTENFGDAILLAGESAHASISNCANLLDLNIITIPCNDRGEITAATLAPLIKQLSAEGRLNQVVAIVASAGSTNSGQIDDLYGLGSLAKEHDIWFHVDAAYGGAFLCVPEVRPLFNGIEMANSFIIDPHKGLFAPYDCCALLYSDPQYVTSAFSQSASYLDHINGSPEWNPMHYAFHLTRRARGVPLWFSLSVYGEQAYTQSLTNILELTSYLKNRISECPELELIVETSLSIVLFKRLDWDTQQYFDWADRCLTENIAFVVPTQWQGDTVIRLCVMNTQLEEKRVDDLFASLTNGT